ncbi:hypothetical protein NN561_012839 [Cricetulus griseus]
MNFRRQWRNRDSLRSGPSQPSDWWIGRSTWSRPRGRGFPARHRLRRGTEGSKCLNAQFALCQRYPRQHLSPDQD